MPRIDVLDFDPFSSGWNPSKGWCLFLNGGGKLLAFTEFGDVYEARPGEPSRTLMRKHNEFFCFTNQPKAILGLADARFFETKSWGMRISYIRMDDGPKITRVPQPDPPMDPYSYAQAFSVYMEWLASIGVRPDKRAGWNTLGTRLWQKTDGRIRFNGPEQSRLALYGGRKQAPWVARFRLAQHFDISAAYLSALSNFTMPKRLAATSGKEWKLPDHDGILYARIFVPDHFGSWGPLPVRADKRIIRFLRFPTGKELEGWWTFSEFRMAVEHGCQPLDIVEQYGGRSEGAYFSQWGNVMLEGRALPNGASFFAKQHANLLWSRFSMTSAPVLWKRYEDHYGHYPQVLRKQKRGKSFSDRSSFVAAICSARVRQQLFRDVLFPDGAANPFVVHCDTDGAIVGTHSHLPSALHDLPDTVTPGSWRLTKRMPLVEVRNPNSYRYTCEQCSWDHARWHYVCAGSSNRDSAERRFKKGANTSDAINLDSLDIETLDERLADYVPRKRQRKYAK